MHITRREWIQLVLLFAVTRLLLVAVGVVAMSRVPSTEGEEYTHLLDGGAALDMWYRWDAGFYATIATYGYDWQNEQRPTDDMAFFPFYPYAMRGVMALTECVFSRYLSTCATVAGLIVSNVALFAATLLLYDLTRRYADIMTAWRAVALLLLSPGSIFLSGVYTEALFLCLSLLVFWLLARDRFPLAVLVAGLACLTRSVGVALVPVLLLHAWRSSPERRPYRLFLSFLPAALLASYILIAGLTAGDPLAYFQANNAAWGRMSGSPIDAFAAYFRGEDVSWVGWRLSWLDLAATLGYLALAVAALRRRVGWGLFALVALLVPILTGTLISMPRYGTVIFPFYIVLAVWAHRIERQALVYGASVALLLLFAIRFVTWRWIA